MEEKFLYNEPIFLQPIFQKRIWGGNKLKTEFNYRIPFENTGEAWVISAQPKGPSIIKNGPLMGKSLLHAWNNHGELFNKKNENKKEYPLLVKILDAKEDLSVQVHPDDQFARELEGKLYGKTECWYVLNAERGAEIVLGHHAKTREELSQMIDNGHWDKLLKRIKVKEGDFFYVPSGTIHAIGKGIVVLETQQNSDITFRVYDYGRIDANGQMRQLHLAKAKKVSIVPHTDVNIIPKEEVLGDLLVKQLIKDTYFTVCHWKLNGIIIQELMQNFLHVSVVKGTGGIRIGEKSFPINKESHFLLPYGIEKYELYGDVELIVSWVQ